jgi:hypothetical protein
MIRKLTTKRRSGATVAEAAIVLGLFLFCLFSIFEYCRYLFVLQTLTQAARQGVRYASVNVSKPTNFDTVDYVEGTVTYPSVVKFTTDRAAGMQNTLGTFSIEVFPCDMDKLAQTPPLVDKKPGFPSSTVTWNSAIFTEMICVRIKGTYFTAVPNVVFWNGQINLQVEAISSSEG